MLQHLKGDDKIVITGAFLCVRCNIFRYHLQMIPLSGGSRLTIQLKSYRFDAWHFRAGQVKEVTSARSDFK
jgi:hypothetical protein